MGIEEEIFAENNVKETVLWNSCPVTFFDYFIYFFKKLHFVCFSFTEILTLFLLLILVDYEDRKQKKGIKTIASKLKNVVILKKKYIPQVGAKIK